MSETGGMKRRLPILLALVLTASNGMSVPVDYTREIKPVFAEHCYRCHGASQHKGELRMDTAASMLKGGDNGPAYVSGKSAESLIIQALKGTHDDISQMPYKKPPLPDAQIELIARWIDEGAKAPADEKPQSEKHWAFVPPVRATPPTVKQTDWVRNDIDRFILARLESEKIKPSPEADRVTLIRRVTLDLIGLLPSPAEVDAFVNDRRPEAYERLVEKLLTSPHYGERWGRHWLDVARYADSNGYSIDAPRNIWKYRDWVIAALNRDLPYDQFVIEQLAGDLLPNATQEQKVATGFHRNTQINQEGGIDPEQFRIEAVLDRVNTTGTAFLGLTVACAQCHDHKFDPVSQREYYELFAFFNNQDEPNIEVATREELAKRDAYRANTKTIEMELKKYEDSIAANQTAWEASLTAEQRAKLKAEVEAALLLLPEQRNEEQKKAARTAFLEHDAGYKKLQKKLDKFKKDEPKIATTMVLVERKMPRESYIFVKGDFTRKGDIVTPGTLKVLNPLPETQNPNRLDFARWLVDAQNPLTARVQVNRIWQQYFGRGLVETENDFGTQGIPPTHPELLDWLATEFMTQKWSLKAMHRLIVNSATYRQSSRVRQDLVNVDANNKLLARQSRLRLDAEIVRDVALSASGLLNPKIGGPSVYPPQPDGVMTLGQGKREWIPDTGENRYRRGMYTFFWRATPHPALMVFDSADGFSACTRRPRSNTPLQALTLLNDQGFVEFAQALAARVLKAKPKSNPELVEMAFRLCLSRKPSAEEKQRLLELLAKEQAAFARSPQEATAMLPAKQYAALDRKELAAWTTVSRVLLNLDETITRE
jgi:mono/diheme cytochrome c family protein